MVDKVAHYVKKKSLGLLVGTLPKLRWLMAPLQVSDCLCTYNQACLLVREAHLAAVSITESVSLIKRWIEQFTVSEVAGLWLCWSASSFSLNLLLKCFIISRILLIFVRNLLIWKEVLNFSCWICCCAYYKGLELGSNSTGFLDSLRKSYSFSMAMVRDSILQDDHLL